MATGTFGPTNTGYIRPTLAQLIAQEKNAMLAGAPSLGFSAGSPELAIAEARAKLRNDEWQARECEFNSFDISNTSGCALDIAARLQGFSRLPDETDDDFKARISGANTGTGFVTSLETAIGQIPDVCRVRVYNNNTQITDSFTGNTPCSFEVVYQGGDAQAIAEATWNCSTGVTNVGSTEVFFEDDSGICRQVMLTEAIESPQCVRITVDTYQGSGGCDNQTFESIQSAAFEALSSKSINIGQPIYAGTISSTVYSRVGNIDIRNVEFAPSGVDLNGDCTCAYVAEGDWQEGPLQLGHQYVPTFEQSCIVIVARDR